MLTKFVKKLPKYGQKLFSRLKEVQKWFWARKKILAKLVKKWPKNCQKMFSRAKRVEKVILGPEFFFY